MRRALALAAAVVSARQDHLCAEDVCFYHVPKTGGDSFKYLLRDELKAHGRTFWSNEWCPRRSNGTSTMVFREPRAHVVSQYFECRDSEWALGNRANAGADVLRGRLERYAPDAWRDTWQPRDVEFHPATLTFAYSKNEHSLKEKRRIEGTVAGARALKLHLAGCIPVIFSLQNELVAPWFVPRGVAVRLSERAYGNGTFKALDVLRRIPSEEIRRRQSIIRKHGHRLQYAVDDQGKEPDAVEALFVGALGLAHDLAHLYQV